MGISVELIRPRHLTRVAAVAVLAGLAAGCSSDTSRFTSNPFSNPFRSQPEQTASVPEGSAYPVPRVRTQPLPSTVPATRSIAVQPLPPVGSVGTVPARRSPVPTYGSNALPSLSNGTGSVAPRIVASTSGGWSSQGGTVVTARAGDTVALLSNRYGVPAQAIMTTNGLAGQALSPGQEITIPVYSVDNAPARPAAPARTATRMAPQLEEAQVPRRMTAAPPLPQAVRPRPVAEAAPVPPRSVPSAQAEGLHVVRPGETLTSIAQSYGTTRPRLAKVNAIDEWTSVRIGQKLRVPGASVAAAPAAAPAKAVVARTTAARAIQTASAKVQASPNEVATKPAKPVIVASRADPKVALAKPLGVTKPTVKVAAAEAEDTDPSDTASVPVQADAAPQPAPKAAPQFRWPVKGRVIQGFGQSSDGINISVPEGTEVKAAENGVVAYAGNELKGYGNLVLIRHADGYVTAYAHARDLSVKRGDTVKRGQTIATAGQTGNVTSPQVLFELRKGATPVDPRQYLSGT